ncbi:MAG TPA: thiosulfate oxidation carrier complex protein SoxZ [Arcobacter sp.]|nr:thiosulfate oxidation carrier complex protein SoxZ [Arcobacter sp.]
MRIKAKIRKEYTVVKMMAKHVMLSKTEAIRKKKTANYITTIIATVNDIIVFEVTSSQSLSKNPYLKFKFKDGKKGDKITIKWEDLLGNTKTSSAKLK